ncbi:hypothetical protein [Paenibacillus xerothermodurans]|uniref:Uncharacterized protein n=1 Tax=Paenibacillus xerothermodurans TaxID=1977292 RepID=A0A2W1N949_PAEXE|nr:hypothetical protein [Paenibacillus xerothermodurans]PZE20927.1 hypothetical protein CBW46_009555 [Paenibacillus xerothermodurans]
MKLTLAIVGGGLGLIVTAAAVFMVWLLLQHRQNREPSPGGLLEGAQAADSAPYGLLLRWTYFDYALIGVFGIGSLFLFTDVVAVIRDADSYPLYHYGYLLCGFVFTFLGMLFMVLRFAFLLSIVRSHGALSHTDGTVTVPNHHDEPSHANETK